MHSWGLFPQQGTPWSDHHNAALLPLPRSLVISQVWSFSDGNFSLSLSYNLNWELDDLCSQRRSIRNTEIDATVVLPQSIYFCSDPRSEEQTATKPWKVTCNFRREPNYGLNEIHSDTFFMILMMYYFCHYCTVLDNWTFHYER